MIEKNIKAILRYRSFTETYRQRGSKKFTIDSIRSAGAQSGSMGLFPFSTASLIRKIASRRLHWVLYPMQSTNLIKIFRRVLFSNVTELLRLPHNRIRQTIAQSTHYDEQTSGKPKNNFKKFSAHAIFKSLFQAFFLDK